MQVDLAFLQSDALPLSYNLSIDRIRTGDRPLKAVCRPDPSGHDETLVVFRTSRYGSVLGALPD